eukprot:scaffold667_cov304-Chaetoceros_neogracile.AAC.5
MEKKNASTRTGRDTTQKGEQPLHLLHVHRVIISILRTQFLLTVGVGFHPLCTRHSKYHYFGRDTLVTSSAM